MEFSVLKALTVFVAMALTDVFYTLWVRRVQTNNPLASGAFAAMLLLFSGYVTISYTSHPIYLGFALLGAFVGTASTVYLDKRSK